MQENKSSFHEEAVTCRPKPRKYSSLNNYFVNYEFKSTTLLSSVSSLASSPASRLALRGLYVRTLGLVKADWKIKIANIVG
jgi:hypothetical protein